MAAMRSDWNPEGYDYNCVACVARYLLDKLTGRRLHAWENAHLDSACQPQELTGNAPRVALQKRSAIHRAVALIETVGLRAAAEPVAAEYGKTYPVGHYAVIGLGSREGHVIYGRVDHPNSEFAEMFCPQTNVRATYGRVGPQAVAVRFEAATKN